MKFLEKRKRGTLDRAGTYKPSKMIIENNKRDLQYYSHLFSQHYCNYKQEWLKTKKSKKSKNAQPRLELAPFERPIVV